jgi:DNA-binding XRE family transcriptional regulator
LVKNPYVARIKRRVKNLRMMITDVNGRMLRAARSLTGLSQQQVADLAGISRPCLTAWERSSDSVPNANMYQFRRVVSALQDQGIEFRPNGVSLSRPAPLAGTVVHSGAVA